MHGLSREMECSLPINLINYKCRRKNYRKKSVNELREIWEAMNECDGACGSHIHTHPVR